MNPVERPPSSADVSATTKTYTVFRVGWDHYAVPVDSVTRVRPLPATTRLPGQPPHSLGVFHQSGTVVPLWDLFRLFASGAEPPQDPWALVTEQGGHALGLLVDEVVDVVTLAEHQIETGPDARPEVGARAYVTGLLHAPIPAPGDASAGDEERAALVRSWEDGPRPLSDVDRPERGARVLATLAPVYLVDLASVYALADETQGPEVAA